MKGTMRSVQAATVMAAVFRAVTIVLGSVAVCASILGAVAFALVALHSALAPSLGPAGAAFATSGAALAMPMLVTLGVLVAARTSLAERTAPPKAVAAAAPAARPTDGLVDQVVDWITENPGTATVGALSLGIALGISPDLRRTVLHGVDAALDQARPQLH